MLLGPEGLTKSAERDKIRGQIREIFGAYAAQQARLVLTFGLSPNPLEGNRLAAEVNRLLVEEFPDVFGVASIRDYHTIIGDSSQRGKVELEVHFFTGIP